MNSKINKLMIDGLEFIHVENDPKKPAVMLLHGYGASMDDLFPLFEYLAKDWNWFFPNAPLEVPIGPMMSGRAWFPIDMEALNAAMMSGQHRDF
jgi:phospholipase/carboxylesterase